MTGNKVTSRTSRRSVLRMSVLAAGAGPLAAACGAAGGSEAPSAQAKPAVVKVLAFNNPLFTLAQNDLVAALKDSDPTLQPDIITFPGQIDQFREKALAVYAGGDAPDAQWMHPSITSLMASKKLLRPLEDLAKRDKENFKDYYPSLIEQYRWRDATYALTWYTTGTAWFFNKQLYERMGVPFPDQLEKEGKWTHETFLTSMRGITRGTAGDPTRTIGTDSVNMALDWACAWIWRNGGDVFSKDLKTLVLNQPAAVEALQYMADLHLKYQVVVYPVTKPDFADGFKSGRVGLRYAAKADTAPAQNDLSSLPFPLGMVPTYKGKAGRANRQGPLGFGVATSAPNGESGWRWARFMSSAAAASVLLGRGTTLPVKPVHQQLPAFAKSMQPYENKDIWLESSTTSRAMVQPANYQEIATMWTKTWADILAEKAPIKSLLDDLVRQVNPLLAQE
jgi:multiple sugar transport system substrate-binding protein